MSRIYKLSRSALRLKYKLRHHRGHGIHSPFVFDLINKVIEEKTQYYAYDDICQFLDEQGTESYEFTKHHRLLFRLVNHFSVKNILELGSGDGVGTIALTMPFSDSKCISVEAQKAKTTRVKDLYEASGRDIQLFESLPSINSSLDCICINLDAYKTLNLEKYQYLETLLHDESFLIVKDIRTKKKNQALWKHMIESDKRTAVLDLFSIGIVFFNPDLYRWKYQISY